MYAGIKVSTVVLLFLFLILVIYSFPNIVYSQEPVNKTDEIAILNIQSYSNLEGNLTIKFNTTGTADLIITGVNGTSFTEDLQFLELRKGNRTQTDFYYIVEKSEENE